MGRTLPYLLAIICCFYKQDGLAIENDNYSSFLSFQDVPVCTNLVVPINGQTDVPIDTDLSWNAIPEATGYLLTVGRTSGGSQILENFDVGNVTTFDFEVNFNPGETIYVTITPYNSAGNAVNCPEESFTLRTTEVGIPVCSLMHTPEHLSYGAPADTDVFWYAVNGATGYRLTVSTIPGGNDIVDELDVGDTLSYNFPNDFMPGTLVYVKVSPYNQAGVAIGCSRQNFRVAYTEKPECTELVDEIANNPNVDIETNIRWEAAQRAVGYRLSVGTTPNGSDIIDDVIVEGATNYSLAESLPTNSTIYVTLTAYNSLGNTAACTSQVFTTEQLLPLCSSLTEPKIDADIIDVNTGLSWQSSENAEGYRLTVITIPSGINEVLELDVGNTTNYKFDENFTDGDTVYIQITAYNRTGDSIGCNEESFQVSNANLVPPCGAVLSTLDGEKDVSIDTAVSWFENSSADGYLLSLGSAPNRSDILNEIDMGSETSYQPNDVFPHNQFIFVSITPYNSYGMGNACTFTFSTIPRIQNRTTSVNGFSPDGDGLNDFWLIEGIEEHPQNTVIIYNRWGNKVFEVNNYNNFDTVFMGEANVMTSLGAGKLPEGTYFFEILSTNNEGLAQSSGALILKR